MFTHLSFKTIAIIIQKIMHLFSFQLHAYVDKYINSLICLQELNYIEVEFIQKTNQRRRIIHMDDRTPYADVDLSIKADPLPDTDSESEGDS